MIYNYKDLTKYTKAKIVKLDLSGMTQFQISRFLLISTSLIDFYLHRYKTNKIIDGNKRCNICGDWFENTLEYFSPSGYISVDGTRTLRRDCKICRGGQAKEDRVNKTIVVLKMNIKNSVKRRVKRIIVGNIRRLSMSPERKKKIKKCNIKRKALAAEKLQILIDNKRVDEIRTKNLSGRVVR